MVKLGVRYYDPSHGRFTQSDPTGKNAHYTYAGNNPTNNTDPGGGSFLGVASTITGAAGFALSFTPLAPAGAVLDAASVGLSVANAAVQCSGGADDCT